MSYVDIAIIVIVALGALIGLWKGFFKTVISFFGWFVSFLIAFFLTKLVAEALLGVTAIRNFVLGTGDGWSLYAWVASFLPADIENATGVWGFLIKPLLSLAQGGGAEINTSVGLLLANGLFYILVCLGLFIAIRIVLLLFTVLANHLTKFKAIGALNRFFGFLVGAVKNLGFVCIVFIVLRFFMGAAFMAPVREQIDKSVLGKPLSETVYTMTDKFWKADGNLLDKLLSMAGIEKQPETPEPQAEREALKTAMGKMLYDSPLGKFESDTFLTAFNLGSVYDDTLNAHTAALKTYVDSAIDKLNSPQSGLTAEQYTQLTALVSAAETNGAVFEAVQLYLAQIQTVKTAIAADPNADVSEGVTGAMTALNAISGEIATHETMTRLFGTINFTDPPQAESETGKTVNAQKSPIFLRFDFLEGFNSTNCLA